MIDDIKKFSLGRKMYPSGIINFNKNNFNEKNKGKSNLGSERVTVNFTVLYLLGLWKQYFKGIATLLSTFYYSIKASFFGIHIILDLSSKSRTR